MVSFNSQVPLSLYIHFPWCIRKCPYCDFNSHATGQNVFPEPAYIDALIRDLEFELARIRGRSPVSIFIGGGTPSLISEAGLERLMSIIRSHLDIRYDTEITLEANPGTADSGRFKAYRELGFNRLSIGVQSFDNQKLERLGRIHTRDEVFEAIEMARAAAFENLNLDIMFALPGQSIVEAVSDLQIAVRQGPEHISWYQLTIEANTIFHKQPPELPDEDAGWAMQSQGKGCLAGTGYRQYEVSAYALNGRQCRHNLNYWQFGDYLGIGAGAHGKLTDVTNGTVTRFARDGIPTGYMANAGTSAVITRTQELQGNDVMLEFMLNALRLIDGISPSLFLDRTGMPISVIEAQLLDAQRQGLIEWNNNYLKPTVTGQQYLNDLLQIFLREEPESML